MNIDVNILSKTLANWNQQLFSCPVVSYSETPWPESLQAFLSLTISWGFPKFIFIASVMSPSHLILWCTLLLLPSIFSSIRDFSSELVVHIRWPKYRSFSFSISPSNEFSGLISFRVVCFDLLAVQGTLKSLLQQYSSKASVLQCSAIFIVQLQTHSWLLEKP